MNPTSTTLFYLLIVAVIALLAVSPAVSAQGSPTSINFSTFPTRTADPNFDASKYPSDAVQNISYGLAVLAATVLAVAGPLWLL